MRLVNLIAMCAIAVAGCLSNPASPSVGDGDAVPPGPPEEVPDPEQPDTGINTTTSILGNVTLNGCRTLNWAMVWPGLSNPFNAPGAWAVDDPTLDFSSSGFLFSSCDRIRLGSFERPVTIAYEVTARFGPQHECIQDIPGRLYYYALGFWVDDAEIVDALAAQGFPVRYGAVEVNRTAGFVQTDQATLTSAAGNASMTIHWEGEVQDVATRGPAVFFDVDGRAGRFTHSGWDEAELVTNRVASLTTEGTRHASIQGDWTGAAAIYGSEVQTGDIQWIDDPSCSP